MKFLRLHPDSKENENLSFIKVEIDIRNYDYHSIKASWEREWESEREDRLTATDMVAFNRPCSLLHSILRRWRFKFFKTFNKWMRTWAELKVSASKFTLNASPPHASSTSTKSGAGCCLVELLGVSAAATIWGVTGRNWADLLLPPSSPPPASTTSSCSSESDNSTLSDFNFALFLLGNGFCNGGDLVPMAELSSRMYSIVLVSTDTLSFCMPMHLESVSDSHDDD